MIKIGLASGTVLVSMTKQEFKTLTKKNEDDVPDGSVLDSDWLSDLIDTVKDNDSLLKKIKKDCESLATNIGNIT
jgi:hypothetical protein